MKVLVTGSAGQLAFALRQQWTDADLVLPDESQLDLTRPDSIRAAIQSVRPDAVVNAGAFTQVDKCEAEPERALLVNGTAVGWLAEACAAAGALLVQVSTDYVFDGRQTRPYREDDPTGPLSVYGHTKLLGERNARLAPEHLIVRTAWLYDAHGRNFFNTMRTAAAQGRSLRVVDDQRGAPTTCTALARQLKAAVLRGWRGTVHATCAGETTWFGFAREIFNRLGIPADLQPCRTAEYPLPAVRPAYSVLSGARRASLGENLMPSWEEGLAQVLATLGVDPSKPTMR
jgi:dTDP-4-dehydrorhamnose reductase